MHPYIKHINIQAFRTELVTWYQSVKRDLPWRKNLDPYAILVSEIMLQQTQVATVIPYFNSFMKKFPTAKDLADADADILLESWAGLGYYSRARNLQESAKTIAELGAFPTVFSDILSLKGVGPYTAGAVASIAFGMPVPAVDGNVFRVISRISMIDLDIAKARTRKTFETVVSLLIDPQHAGDFNQGLMELGATICTPTSPKCGTCPLQNHCLAYRNGVDEQYPVKSKTVRQKTIKYIVALVKNEHGQRLVTKREETGLLANFYEFPQIPYEEGFPTDLLSDELARHNLDMKDIQKGADAKHVFTHLIWHMEAYDIKVCSKNTVLDEHHQWVNDEALENLPLTVAHKKLLGK